MCLQRKEKFSQKSYGKKALWYYVHMKQRPILELENVHVSYEVAPVLKGINLTINAGEHWAILGANGCGKSTLIKLISQDLYPHAKYPYTKKVFGCERWNIFELKKHLGIITNDLHNYFSLQGSYLSAYEVVLSGYYSSIGIFTHQDFTDAQHAKALEVLEFLDIADIKDKKVGAMSTGQLRRCIIGRALIHEPKAFILDEPTVGLDLKAQHGFIGLMKRLSHKASIVLVTHHIEEIFPEISHVALIHKKTIVRQGKKESILTSQNLSSIFDMDITLGHEEGRYYVQSIHTTS